MAEIKIQAEKRVEFGKGAARRIRRDLKVPAVLYGHGSDPVHVTLPGHELMKALRTANVLLEIAIEEDRHLVIPKQVQRDPLRGSIEHADLLIVKRGEKVVVEVQIQLIGEATPGALVQVEYNTITVEAEATNIPTRLEVSIDGLDVGAQIHARNLPLPAGTTLIQDEDDLIVNVTAAPTAEDVESELESAEAAANANAAAPAAAADAAPEAEASTESE